MSFLSSLGEVALTVLEAAASVRKVQTLSVTRGSSHVQVKYLDDGTIEFYVDGKLVSVTKSGHFFLNSVPGTPTSIALEGGKTQTIKLPTTSEYRKLK